MNTAWNLGLGWDLVSQVRVPVKTGSPSFVPSGLKAFGPLLRARPEPSWHSGLALSFPPFLNRSKDENST